MVHDVDVTLAPSRVTAFVGPNGCGKSTLLRTLGRLHDQRSGSVTIEGREIRELSPRAFARRVAVLGQHHIAPSGLSVADVVSMGRHPQRRAWGRDAHVDHEHVDRALTMTGLSDLRDRGLHELSGGEVQRVWIACCLAQDTDLILLDEPTNHLDLRHQVDILDLVRDLADGGATVGIVLHDLDQAAEIADLVVLLRSGRIVASGPPREALTSAHLSTAYDVPVAVHVDPVTRTLTTRALRRRDRGASPMSA